MVNDIKPANASVPYRYQEYPKMIYFADGSNKVVNSAEEEEALKAPIPIVEEAPKVTSIRRKKAQE